MQKKIIIAIIINILLISVTLGIISYITIHESINQALQSKLALANIIAKYVDISLDNSINRLYEIYHSENNTKNNARWQQRQKMLESVYKHSVFTEGIFILDKYGNIQQTYPDRAGQYFNLAHIIHVNDVIQHGQPVISNVYTIEPIQKKVVFIFVPIKDTSGRVNRIIGGMIGPTSELFNELLLSAKKELGGFAEIIDINENIVASSNPSLTFQPHNHDNVISNLIKEAKSGIVECRHSSNYYDAPDAGWEDYHLLTVVPIRLASWAVIIGQPESRVFSPAANLQFHFLIAVIIFIILSSLIAIYLSQKIVSPIKSLIFAVNKLASGDLSTSVGNFGSDETLKLSQSFDEMRQKLADSYETIKAYNTELEKMVESRTREIDENRKVIKQLLMKIIDSQEDERKRVARDLHDTILQDISAFLIKLDILKQHPDIISIEKIDEMRDVAVKTIDNIYSIIKNLRPSMLDDLGLEAAINVVLTEYLTSKGISFKFDVKSPLRGKLLKNVEISVFRIVQEAIRNINRHAQAKNVDISLEIKGSFLVLVIHDDGIGVSVEEFMHPISDSGRGLGIIGMKERALLLGGNLDIQSTPGGGTKLFIRIPIKEE